MNKEKNDEQAASGESMKDERRDRTHLLAVYPDQPSGKLWTTFADFRGLADLSDDLPDAIRQSTAFLEALVGDMIQRGEPLPVPSELAEYRKKLDPKDGSPLCIVPITIRVPCDAENVRFDAPEPVPNADDGEDAAPREPRGSMRKKPQGAAKTRERRGTKRGSP